MSFITHFESLEDKRSHINKKRDLLDVIFLTVVAILSGAEGWKDIKQFGDSKLDWLRKFRAFKEGVPVDDTIARIISSLEPNALLTSFISWVNEIREDQGQPVIAFDGKTLRQWSGDQKYWKVKDGAITGTTDGSLKMNRFLTWKGSTIRTEQV